MRSGLAPGKIAPMATALEVSLRLELTDPISGELRPPDGPEQHFDGWLELNSTLERLYRGAREAEGGRGDADQPDTPERGAL